MKADLSRSTFDSTKHYRDVRWQMGRVPLDADFNEYVDIAAHRVETETIDVVGRCGGPVHDAAFQLTNSVAALPPDQQSAATALGALALGDFYLSAGRYYAQGVLVQNDTPMKFTGQASGDLPGAAALTTTGLYLAFLDVWSRHLTFLDDPLIREVALGGPDTATRNKNIWQLRLVRVAATGTAPGCDATFEAFNSATAASTGKLAAEVDPDLTTKKPCVLPPGGGYRRLENQLYRVEIHTPGSANGAATFKWSRDNGAVVSGWEATGTSDTIRLRQPPRDTVLGFTVGQWVELTDDSNELLGTAGQLFEVAQLDGDLLKLKTPVPAGLFVRNPKVRRWDSVNTIPVTTGAFLALEDGVRVRFASGTYKTGDYWMIPARTATADVEWPRPGGAAAFLPPKGIRHAYCRIGFVDFDGAKLAFHDCRPLFPPLTEIDDNCDLKLHNKHLHGKGVVCGLQVVCSGTPERATVRIKPGHAIDCEGTDILLKAPEEFPVLERAKAAKLLDPANNGEVLITLHADTKEEPVFDVVKAPDEPSGTANILKHILEGTLWMDFYNDCLKPLADFLREQLFDKPAAGGALVSAQEKRLLTVMNLFAHRSTSQPSHRLWLSEKQHQMLEELYAGLVKFAGNSATFCAIVDTFAEFPKYPFAKREIATGFLARRVSGALASPDGRFVAFFGNTDPSHAYVFDLAKQELVADLEVPGAAGLAVKGLAFAQFQKKPVLAVLSGNNLRSVLTLLDAEAFKPIGSPFLLDAPLETMVAHSRRLNTLLATQRGAGVHVIDLDTLTSGDLPGPQWKFNAAGHLAVEADRACATVANASAGATGTYTAITFATLRSGEDTFETTQLALAQVDSRVLTGEDGVVFSVQAGQLVVHVATNPPTGRPGKGVLIVDARARKGFGLLELPVADDGSNATGPVALGAIPELGRVVYGLKNRNQLMWSPAVAEKLLPGNVLPAQMAPVALTRSVRTAGAAGEGAVLIAANQESQTFTLIPVKELEAKATTDAELEAYRDALLEAFQKLLLPLLQGLKDCLCQHLLRDCPECTPGETLPLAKVTIRAGKVHHICNFERMEVLTFPKVKYWLSAIPIIPLVSFLVEKFCCWIFAEPKADPATGLRTSAGALAPEVVFGAAKFLKSGDLGGMLSSNFLRAKTLATHFVQDAGKRAVAPSDLSAKRDAGIEDVLEVDANSASSTLTLKGVRVAAVENYDSALGGARETFAAGKLPTTLKAGQSVKLFTRGGKVAFYQVVDDAAASGASGVSPAGATGGVPAAEVAAGFESVRTQIDALRAQQAAELAARDVEVAKLRTAGETLSRELASRDRQLADLKAGNEKLALDVSRLSAAPTTAPTAPAGVTEAQLKENLEVLRREIATLQSRSSTDLAARDAQIAELKTANDKLSDTVTVANRKFEADIKRLSRPT